MNTPHIAVIGGGCAGLSAAVNLLDRGYAVTLLEASPHLGGRARTVLVEHNSLMNVLDNGQHIMLGAYQETLALMRKIGIDEKDAFLRMPLQIRMQSNAESAEFLLQSEHLLPAPFNLLFGLFACKGLSLSERISAIKFMGKLRLNGYKIEKDTFLESYLRKRKQSKRIIEMLWQPLCLAALNTPIEIASTKIFLNLLRDTFSGNKKNSDFLLPIADLSKVIANPLAQYIQAKGGKILLGHQIRDIKTEDHYFRVSGKEYSDVFSHVVVATPPSHLGKLFQSLPQLKSVVATVEAFSYQPIYTIYIQYPADTKLPNIMTGFCRKTSQWAFDRGQLCGQKGLISVIVSAGGRHQELDHDELALNVAKELHQSFPQLEKPLWHKVIAEKRATFSCIPNLKRPSYLTEQANLLLAGDYTYADYPSTIEGAVRSGNEAANLII